MAFSLAANGSFGPKADISLKPKSADFASNFRPQNPKQARGREQPYSRDDDQEAGHWGSPIERG